MEINNITNKQLQILHLLYRYRFLNRNQLQLYLNHKDPRRIKTWLKNLTDKKIINRIYSKKLGENTKPAIYFLGNGSRTILKNQKDCNPSLLNRIYREKLRSAKFIDHCLFMADVFFFFDSLTNQTSGKLSFYTKSDLANFDYLLSPLPDAYIAIEKNKSKTKRYFLEIIDEKVPRFVLRKRIEQYLNYYQEKIWEEKTNHFFPSILLICPNESTKNFLDKYICETLAEEKDIAFFLTTKDKISKENTKENIWEKS